MALKCDLFSILTDDDLRELYVEAKGRVDQQIKDAKEGNNAASYSYGGQASLSVRPYNVRIKHAMMGTMAELIAAKKFKAAWTKQRRQYNKENNEPDLTINLDGTILNCEVRGTEGRNIPFRPYSKKKFGQKQPLERDFNILKKNTILVGVTNLPKGPTIEIAYSSFGYLTKLCKNHQEWYSGQDTSTPYYAIPIEFFPYSEFDY